MKSVFRRVPTCVPAVALAVSLLAGCGEGSISDPFDVTLGETTLVFIVNPAVNGANDAPVPSPGPRRSGVDVAVQGGPSGRA